MFEPNHKNLFKITENLNTNIASEESDLSSYGNLDLKNENKKFKIVKRRMMWSQEVNFIFYFLKEDDLITQLVKQYGTNDWTLTAEMMNKMSNYKTKRSGKQCRERWYNHLDKDIKKNEWTSEEEKILFEKHRQYGNKWSEIVKFLPGR
jgi:hypothetical protein